LAEVVGGSSLNSSSIFWDPSLNSGSAESSWEFLGLSLDSFADWNSQQLFIDSRIEIKVIIHLFLCFLKSSMGCMAFLPKELSCSNERGWMLKLPSYNISPLIQLKREVSVTLDPIGISRIHNCLTCWADGNGFTEVTAS
jgi:hypothetical protein